MMKFQWQTDGRESRLLASDGKTVLTIPAQPGCTDAFEPVEEGAWRWVRTSKTPCSEMKMVVEHHEALVYWQVPSVNYDGNGWGSGAQYAGLGPDGTPWTYAWHRIAIPACTYAEGESWSVSLFGEEKGGMSCSVWKEDEKARQALLWPEQEGPKVLFKRSWMDPFMGEMEPQISFTGILTVAPVGQKRKGYQRLLDFAWRYFERPLIMERSPEDVVRLDTLLFRQLWQRTFEGLAGFCCGFHWKESEAMFVKQKAPFEAGFIGQNISVACTLLREYIKTGEADLRDKALSALDSWVKHAVLPNGLMFVQLVAPPAHLDSVQNGTIPMDLDACNLGTAATYFFKAAGLAEQAGSPRPAYAETALGLCDFALRAQQPTGEFAKSWFIDGSVDSPHGSVGAFLCVPLFDAWKLTGEQKYLDAALRAVDFYCETFEQSGVTTAGALDSFCIDKESAAPILRSALLAWHATAEDRYVRFAEDLAYYLSTWQWHYSTAFPDGSQAKEIGYDTYGGTAVSAAHNAMDPYGVYYVPEFLELAKLTGKKVWYSRARALWHNGIQLISDGTLVINGRVRPAGTQDESMRHTRWGRPDNRIFVLSESLDSWPGSFRQVTLDMLDQWDSLR